MAKSSSVDLSKFTIPELQELAQEIESEIVTRRESAKVKVLEQMRELAGSIGMTPEELLGAGGKGRAGKVLPKYRHPDDASLTWSGRGKRPLWINEVLGAGKTLDDLAVE
jgi:DNA-binding protein H-NS